MQNENWSLYLSGDIFLLISVKQRAYFFNIVVAIMVFMLLLRVFFLIKIWNLKDDLYVNLEFFKTPTVHIIEIIYYFVSGYVLCEREQLSVPILKSPGKIIEMTCMYRLVVDLLRTDSYMDEG